jgi:hypothetical protein
MVNHSYLKVTFKLMALYAGFMGALMLFFHDAAQVLFQREVQDTLTTRYWGGVLLAIAVLYLFISTDPEKYRLLIWVGILDLGTASGITIMNIATGNLNWMQGITGIVINPIFMIIIISGLAGKKEEVVFVAGHDAAAKPGQELPPHLGGHHPLHGK